MFQKQHNNKYLPIFNLRRIFGLLRICAFSKLFQNKSLINDYIFLQVIYSLLFRLRFDIYAILELVWYLHVSVCVLFTDFPLYSLHSYQ